VQRVNPTRSVETDPSRHRSDRNAAAQRARDPLCRLASAPPDLNPMSLCREDVATGRSLRRADIFPDPQSNSMASKFAYRATFGGSAHSGRDSIDHGLLRCTARHDTGAPRAQATTGCARELRCSGQRQRRGRLQVIIGPRRRVKNAPCSCSRWEFSCECIAMHSTQSCILRSSLSLTKQCVFRMLITFC
jgi:hypothetical protein